MPVPEMPLQMTVQLSLPHLLLFRDLILQT